MAVFPTPVANVQSLDSFYTLRTRFNDCANLVNSVIPDTGAINITGSAFIGTNLTVSGNLTISGTSTSLSASELQIQDNIITLNNGAASAVNTGILVNRGSTGANVYILWDETNQIFKIRDDADVNASIEANTFVSTVFTGTPPLSVFSTTIVNNLNAQYLGGRTDGYFVANTTYQSFVSSENSRHANTNAWILTTNTYFGSALANTNDWLANTGSWVANTHSWLTTVNTNVESYLANTNSWLTTVENNQIIYLANTNTWINNNLANTNNWLTTVNTNVESYLANTNSWILSLGANGTVYTADGINAVGANGILVTSDGINFRQTLSEQHTFSIQGAVTTGNTAPHFIMLSTGETMNLIEFRHGLANTTGETTQANTALYINETPISGASQISNNDIRTVTLTPVSLSDDDKLWVKIDNESGSPENLSLTVRMERLKV